MLGNKLILASVLALGATMAMAGEGILVRDAYLVTSRPGAPTAAAFMELVNEGDQDDRLLSVASDLAAMARLHTNSVDANGVARMGDMEGGLPLASGEVHLLESGGDHIMLMGLTQALNPGETVSLKLRFEHAGEITVDLPVNPER